MGVLGPGARSPRGSSPASTGRGQPVDLSTGRASLTPARFDPSIPENAAKLDVVEKLVELATDIGCSLPELAVAFAAAHPAVTLGDHRGRGTMDQLEGLLKGASLTLDDATLDRIDEIVPPGTNLYQPDGSLAPALADRHRAAAAPRSRNAPRVSPGRAPDAPGAHRY
ncbi:hypothetical protein GCM10018952_35440 [Streptosporangium vulgare]